MSRLICYSLIVMLSGLSCFCLNSKPIEKEIKPVEKTTFICKDSLFVESIFNNIERFEGEKLKYFLIAINNTILLEKAIEEPVGIFRAWELNLPNSRAVYIELKDFDETIKFKEWQLSDFSNLIISDISYHKRTFSSSSNE